MITIFGFVLKVYKHIILSTIKAKRCDQIFHIQQLAYANYNGFGCHAVNCLNSTKS